MKKTIRLSESELKNMVREAINELDWKTYANAAKKRRENGDSAWDLDRAVERNLDRKFGTHPNVETNDTAQRFWNNNPNDKFAGIDSADVAWRPLDGHEDFGNFSDISHDYPGSDEINDFVNGKYGYRKGKGWTKDGLDEAVTRAIRKYLR